jgi:hypothetical protein
LPKVQSVLLGNMWGKTTGVVCLIQINWKTYWLPRVSQKRLASPSTIATLSQRATLSNCGKLSWQQIRLLLFVWWHIQVITTAQEPKGLSCSTKRKARG